ncbi:MAG TPA: YggS family pyridoxal phosphate-dependent enzyme [bacterium]|nr:YggS family pyridoxal phosphate-dependent enzyme [bacterium]
MSIRSNIAHICSEITSAARSAGRSPDRIRLVAVSKTHPAEAVRTAFHAGQTIFGESRVQEAEAKIDMLAEPIEWHLVGHLQSNKCRIAVQLFEVIHAVDSLKLIRELDKRASGLSKRQKILLQVNVSGEQSKFGVTPDRLPALVSAAASSDHLELKGLMTIPPFTADPESSRPYFVQLRELAEIEIAGRGIVPAEEMELSMGMSGDFRVAVEEGATLVRVGTAIFGERNTG